MSWKSYTFKCQICREIKTIPARSMSLAIARLKKKFGWVSVGAWDGPWRCKGCDGVCNSHPASDYDYDYETGRPDDPAAA